MKIIKTVASLVAFALATGGNIQVVGSDNVLSGMPYTAVYTDKGFTVNEYYPTSATVTYVNKNKDIVSVRDYEGNVWKFYGCDNYQVDDTVAMILNDNGTEDIHDDIIVSVRFSGIAETRNFYNINGIPRDVGNYQRIEKEFLEQFGYTDATVYDSAMLSESILENRLGTVVIERCIGLVTGRRNYYEGDTAYNGCMPAMRIIVANHIRQIQMKSITEWLAVILNLRERSGLDGL